jgi:hypothetical protein
MLSSSDSIVLALHHARRHVAAFAAAGGMADVDRVAQIEMFNNSRCVGSVEPVSCA